MSYKNFIIVSFIIKFKKLLVFSNTKNFFQFKKKTSLYKLLVMYKLADKFKRNAQKYFEKKIAKSSIKNFTRGKCTPNTLYL